VKKTSSMSLEEAAKSLRKGEYIFFMYHAEFFESPIAPKRLYTEEAVKIKFKNIFDREMKTIGKIGIKVCFVIGAWAPALIAPISQFTQEEIDILEYRFDIRTWPDRGIFKQYSECRKTQSDGRTSFQIFPYHPPR